MWTVDGALQSGSGTIVRTSLVLSALTGEPVKIANIRARRDRPGMRAQHSTLAKAVAQLTGGELEGNRVGSDQLSFRPAHRPGSGDFQWDIGTAGSTTMLISALLPLMAMAAHSSIHTVMGGVFQDFAPSAFHLQACLLPVLEWMGHPTQFEITRPGYFPKGGGIVRLSAAPLEGRLRPLQLLPSSENFSIRGISLSSHLEKQQVSERMANSCQRKLRAAGFESDFRVVRDNTAIQPGAALAAFATKTASTVIGADCSGARGRRSELIGERVARQLLDEIARGATVDRHLADQLILFSALASGTSEFVFPFLTDHVQSNLGLVKDLLGVRYELNGNHLVIEGIGFDFS